VTNPATNGKTGASLAGVYKPGKPAQAAFGICIYGKGGCVAPETIIQGPDGNHRIDDLAASGKPFRVWSIDPATGDRVAATATYAFLKGVEELFDVTLSDGRCITATAEHRFLTAEGVWLPLRRVSVGQRLSCGQTPRESSSGTSLSASHEGALRYSQTGEGSRERCLPCSRPDGQLPRLEEGIFRELSPSQGDARERTRVVYKDDLGLRPEPTHNRRRRSTVSLPSRTCFVRDEVPSIQDALGPLVRVRLQPHYTSSQSAVPSRSRSILETSIGAVHLLEGQVDERVSVNLSACVYPLVVSAITINRVGVYYDMHVPVYENYLAEGFWNHNTGKTTLLGTMPGRGLVIDVPQIEGGTFVLQDQANRIDIVPVETWDAVDAIYWFLMKSDHPYQWVAIDSLTAMTELAKRKTIKERDLDVDPHVISLQEWGKIGRLVGELVYRFRTLKQHTIWIAQERKFGGGGDEGGAGPVTLGPDTSPAALQALLPSMLLVGRLSVEHSVDGWERQLRVGPHAMYVTKARAVPGQDVPPIIRNPSLAGLLKFLLARPGAERPDEVLEQTFILG